MVNTLYNNKLKSDNNIKFNPYENMLLSNIVIKGEILKKDGKNIRIKSEDNTILDIVTKNNLNLRQGTILSIKKSEVETITKISDEQIENEKEREKKEIEELEKDNIAPTKENLDSLKNLKNSDIPLTKENILKFASIKSSLINLSDNINMNSIAMLINSGSNLDNMSIFEFNEALKNKDIKFYEKNIAGINSKINEPISYDDARKISDKIYGSKMGKDIYDIIIALKQNDIDLNKENIDKMHDMFSKLYDLKNIDNDDIIKAFKLDETISIDLLYKVKNYITNSSISSGKIDYSNSNIIPDDNQLEKMSDEITKILKSIGFGEKELGIAKSIIKNNLDLNFENISNIKQISEDIIQVQKILDKNIAGILIKSGIDISSIDIRTLLQEIISITKEMENIENLMFTKEEMDLAGQLIQAMKEINSNAVLTNSVKAMLNSTKTGKNLYDKLFSNSKYSSIISYESSVSIKTSIVLTSIESINLDLIDLKNNNISFKYLAQRHSLFNEIKENFNLQKLEYNTEVQSIIQAKTQLIEHYEYLKMNMRATHINELINSGINPFDSDIRRLSNIIKDKNYKNEEFVKTMNSLDKLDINKISSTMISSQSEVIFKNIQKAFDIEHNKNNYIDHFSKLADESQKKNFKEINEIIKKIENSLKNNISLSKEDLRNNLDDVYLNLKEMEKIIFNSDRKDKDIFQKILENISENIKETYKLNSKEEMLQIPFYMNGEGNNANVYARTKKNKKGKINPDDMSLLIDLNTKNLGKMGFYIKVDNKKLSIKISGSENSMNTIKSNIVSLDNNLSSLGYDIDFIDLISPDNKAKLSFVEENIRNSNANIDVFV